MHDPSNGHAVPGELAGRFVLRRCLGQGGFGVVHEAQDRALGTDVALKELLIIDPAALYAFKQEFRALADVTHPNLVGLQELFTVGGRWYLSMDLVRGENFLRHVRPGAQPLGEPTTDPSHLRPPDPEETDELRPFFRSGLVTLDASRVSAFARTMIPGAHTSPSGHPSGGSADAAPAEARPLRRPPRVALGVLDPARLRAALLQLAEGVDAIHRSGRVHRDLKPSNVLVTHAGRVVILDFGLVASFSSAAGGGATMGTPVYMAPEQVTSVSVTAAVDWYAVGVMVYEALTGGVPHLHEGTSLMDLLLAKSVADPPAPRALADVPADLSDLCMRLLDRDPATRAGAAEIRRALGTRSGAVPSAAPRPTFVGRAAELQALRAAYDAARRKATVVVHVHGTSGMGKSDLVRHLLDGLPAGDTPIVLEGRCHEREWVPYKAFDGIIDAVARWLDELPRDALARLVPPNLGALIRLFPILARLDTTGTALDAEVPDPQELRRRAFVALRALLSALGRKYALVLYIDDVQWADGDSAALLDALLAPPDPPPCLLLASYRTEEAAASAFVASLPSPTHPIPGIDTFEVLVGPLSHGDSAALARALLPAGDPASDRRAERIAREAGGSPFFVQELARHAASGADDEAVKLSEVVDARVAALAPDIRGVLELVSAAGRPVAPAVLKAAAGLDDEREQAALALLRAGCLVRARGRGDAARVEAYHDKIREAVVRGLAPDTLRARHLDLARAMEALGVDDPEALAMHFQGAGDPGRARTFFERAAQRAERTLAFVRAATYYRSALELAAASEQPAIELRLADALTKAGRGAEAAAVFLHAAGRVGPAEALTARRRAVEQLLRAGHIDEGLDVARVLLPQVGMKLTATPRHALVSMLASRVKLRLRGLEFVERPESMIDPEKLHRIDLCWSLGNGLGGTDMIRGADFQARHLLLSLEAGEPYRIARAFAWEAVLRSLEGSPSSLAHAQDLAARAEVIARRIQHPHAIAWSTAGKALVAHNSQRFRDAVDLCERSIAQFREACTDIAWEVASLYALWLLSAKFYLGDVDGLRRLLPACQTEAETLGDRYMLTGLGVYTRPADMLLAGRPDEALRTIDAALAAWTSRGFHSIHNLALWSRVNALVYLGDGARAHTFISDQWKALESSFLLRTKASRIRMTDARARALLAALRGRRDEPALRQVLQWADDIEREKTAWSDGQANALRAAVALRRHDPERARLHYARAQSAFLLRDMELLAHAAERQLATLESDRLRLARIDAWMKARGVADPERVVDTFIPS